MKKTKRNLAICLLATACWMFAAPAFSQGKLEQMETEAKSDNNSSSENSSSESTVSYFDADSWVFMIQTTYCLFVRFNSEPRVWLGPNQERGRGFTPYPFANGAKGIYYANGEGGSLLSGSVRGHFFAESLDLHGQLLNLRLSPHPYLSFEGNFIDLAERRANGTTDRMNLWTAGVQFNRVRQPAFNLYWGGSYLQLNGLEGDHYKTATFDLGFKWFIKQPVSLQWDWKWGALNGNSTMLHDLRLHYHLKQLAFYLGLQAVKVGDVPIVGASGGACFYFAGKEQQPDASQP